MAPQRTCCRLVDIRNKLVGWNHCEIMGLRLLGSKNTMTFQAAKRALILIVEDELLIRQDAVDMIEAAGFEVVQAGNADEAIKILEARSDIQLVFTDIQMPGSMDGLRLAAAVRGRWPPIKIVATSGHYALRDGELPEGSVFMQKPYNSATVGRVLHEMIGT
jgi:CheY-like chemotaxis protein